MDEGFEFLDNEEEAPESISKFEEMLSKNGSAYFDLSELEEIIDFYLFREEYSKVEQCIALGMSLHPTSALLHLKRSYLMFDTGQVKEAIEEANAAETFEPRNIDVLLQKAQLYSAVTDRKQAVKYLRLALEQSEFFEQEDILMDISAEYQAMGQFVEAAKTLEELIAKFPDNQEALYELAFSYDLCDNHERSAQMYNAYLNEDPYSFIAWYNLGNTYCKMADFENAVEAFDYATIIKPDLSSAHFNMGNAYSQFGEYAKAIESFKEAREHEGDQALTLTYIGENYEKLGELETAKEFYSLATQLDPDFADAWVGLGIVEDLKNNTKSAIPFLEKAVKLDNSNFSHWVVLGNAYEKTESVEDAESCYRKALELKKSISDAYLDLSNLLFECGKYKEAIEVIMQGLKYSDDSKSILEYRLIAFLFAEGNNKEALKRLRAALETNFSDHTELFDYYPELSGRSEIIELISKYSK